MPGPAPDPNLMDSLGLFAPVEWRHVVGSGGDYEVSDSGQVQSWVAGNRHRSWRRAFPKLLAQGSAGSRDGSYKNVSVKRAGRYRSVYVHTLVLEAFVGPCPPGMEACHANDNGFDNRLLNLRWGTPVSNWSDRKNNGNGVDGEQNPAAKIDKRIADRVRLHLADGLTQKQAGACEGVSQTTVWRIATGKAWI